MGGFGAAQLAPKNLRRAREARLRLYAGCAGAPGRRAPTAEWVRDACEILPEDALAAETCVVCAAERTRAARALVCAHARLKADSGRASALSTGSLLELAALGRRAAPPHSVRFSFRDCQRLGQGPSAVSIGTLPCPPGDGCGPASAAFEPFYFKTSRGPAEPPLAEP